jgi:hypothetical protein
MKNSTINDKDWFFIGAMLGAKKELFTGHVQKALYKKDTSDSQQTTTSVPVTTAGVAVQQITAGKIKQDAPTVTGANTLGSTTASTALDWTEESIAYSIGNRLASYKVDNSSFVSRLLHTIIESDTDYATGNTGYNADCTSALDLWGLIDYVVSRKAVIAANCCPQDILVPGDLIFLSKNKTNACLFHATDVEVYLGDNLVAAASRTYNGLVVHQLDVAKAILVARPYLVTNEEDGITITDDMIGTEKYKVDSTEYTIPVFVDNFYAYCTNQ